MILMNLGEQESAKRIAEAAILALAELVRILLSCTVPLKSSTGIYDVHGSWPAAIICPVPCASSNFRTPTKLVITFSPRIRDPDEAGSSMIAYSTGTSCILVRNRRISYR